MTCLFKFGFNIFLEGFLHVFYEQRILDESFKFWTRICAKISYT